MEQSKKIKALGLCSGGLDSILSAMILKEQQIEVHWISFETPFFSANKARNAAKAIDIPIVIENITSTYIDLLRNPHCGFGKNMNPCTDCHTLMFQLAGQKMQRDGYDFLFSGEVLGQRPMSQVLSSLNYVEKRSGFSGYILRPLSAKRLKPTIAETNGWVDREKLLDLSGRSRKPQIALARKYGISEYPAPAGGCLLTDKGYSQRLKDLMQHQKDFSEDELHLLKYGRHLRLNDQVKLIVGRTQKENEQILSHWNSKREKLLKTSHVPGPTALISHGADSNSTVLGAAICAGYSKAPNDKPAQVQVIYHDEKEELRVLPLPPQEAKRFLLKG